LLDDGRVLVVGGFNSDAGGELQTAQIYNPATNTWRYTRHLHNQRFAHTTTLLSDGRVLVAGGSYGAFIPLRTAEIYDPRTGEWTVTGRMIEHRAFHAAVLLNDGRVLVSGGGISRLTSEIFDPAIGTWTAVANMQRRHHGHTATLLNDGSVLIAGGFRETVRDYASHTAEVYDPAQNTWTLTGQLNRPRYDHTATLPPSGQVAAIGGFTNSDSYAPVETYDPATGVWTFSGNLNQNRAEHSATLLSDGTILVAGGNHHGTVSTAEIGTFGPP
jgi:Kelch motif